MLSEKQNNERQIPYALTYMWNLKQTKTEPSSQIRGLVVLARGWGEGEGGHKTQTSSYKIKEA